MPATPCINAIATATPPHDVHPAFIEWAARRLTDRTERRLFDRMVARAQIEHRWSVLAPGSGGGTQTDPGGFYDALAWPGTADRMTVYAREAPALAERAVAGLGSLDGVTHLILASCTGFVAPGIDQILARRLGLSDRVERTLIGFMGCYAAVSALRTAYHIVRSQPDAKALVVSVELSSLHLQASDDLKSLLSMLLFADGAAAAIVSAQPSGLAIEAPFSLALPGSDDLITWDIGDTGFAMQLSGKVPERITGALADRETRARLTGGGAVNSWAVHAGGRSILDAVEQALGLPEDALQPSRKVLNRYGNMSSATLLFVLHDILRRRPSLQAGVAMAFGPGMAVEGFRYAQAA